MDAEKNEVGLDLGGANKGLPETEAPLKLPEALGSPEDIARAAARVAEKHRRPSPVGWCEDEIGPPEGLHPAGKDRYVSDRLWVGPERQAWLEERMGDPEMRARAYRAFGSKTLEEMCWVREVPASPTCTCGEIRDCGYHDVVLGLDGRWRWTLDLGIEPR